MYDLVNKSMPGRIFNRNSHITVTKQRDKIFENGQGGSNQQYRDADHEEMKELIRVMSGEDSLSQNSFIINPQVAVDPDKDLILQRNQSSTGLR